MLKHINNEKTLRILEFVVNTIVVISLAWFSVYGFGQKIKNIGQSMQPAIIPGETVLLNKVIYNLKPPKRFDIVYFVSNDGRDNIKRIIGLPGETIQIKESKVYINGIGLEGDYSDVTLAGLAAKAIFLGSEEYCVLGDNRDSSEDSRFDSIGNVRRGQIKGKVWFRVSDLGRFGFIDKE